MLARVVNDTNDSSQGLFQIYQVNVNNYTIPYLCDAVICCIDPNQTGLQAFTVVLTSEFPNADIEYDSSRGTISLSSNVISKTTYLTLSGSASIRTIIAFPS